MYRLFTALMLSSLLVGVACQPVVAADQATAQALVEETIEEVMQALRSDRQRYTDNTQALHGLINRVAFPHFNFELMAKRVLGKAWRRASREQRDEFLSQFRLMMLHTYSAALLSYVDGKVRYLEPKPGRDEDEVVVRAVASTPGAEGLPVSYFMGFEDGRWLAFDIIVDGVSLVINYRASFAGKVRKHGLDHLIAELKGHNQRRMQ